MDGTVSPTMHQSRVLIFTAKTHWVLNLQLEAKLYEPRQSFESTLNLLGVYPSFPHN